MWKKRFFLRKGVNLFNFEADSNMKPMGEIRDVFDLRVWRAEKTTGDRPHMIRFVHSITKDEHLLSTNTQDEVKYWIKVLNDCYLVAQYENKVAKIILCQSIIRMRKDIKQYKKLKIAATKIQTILRKHNIRNTYLEKKKNVIKCQSVVRRWICLRRFKLVKRRILIVKELVATETSYVINLQIVDSMFTQPLMDLSSTNTPILSPEEIAAIFVPIQPILTVNSMLLEDLESRLSQWHVDKKIGRLMANHMNTMKGAYVTYILDYPEIISSLTSVIKKNNLFTQYISKIRQEDKYRTLDLPSIFIQPIQRLPRYELLLKDLIKHTPKTHPDYSELHTGLDMITEVTKDINEKRRVKDNSVAFNKLKGALTGKLAKTIKWAPYHIHLREGDVQVSNNKKVMYMFALNEFLLFTQKDKDKHKLLSIIFVKNITSMSSSVEGTVEKIVINVQGADTLTVSAPRSSPSWSSLLEKNLEEYKTRGITLSQ
eukprot:TRINITY_DN2607_c0_g1_i2.p1 TRINITY_DN2607_c0_g1~~TRINITY_DN2607_c0_g1_i2.p1  ORF type:complete len:485 (-),score=88.69 TRINITY_DN2607_c0_g1_i2:46-1500(-)